MAAVALKDRLLLCHTAAPAPKNMLKACQLGQCSTLKAYQLMRACMLCGPPVLPERQLCPYDLCHLLVISQHSQFYFSLFDLALRFDHC